MCPECKTTDASLPLVPGCKSCAETISMEERAFWNEPLYWDTEELPDGAKTSKPIYAKNIMRKVRQPLKALFHLITLT